MNFKPNTKWLFIAAIGIINTHLFAQTNAVFKETELSKIKPRSWLIMPGFIDKGAQETIKLVPLGTTTLRVTIFPDLEKRFSK
jgi:hypothetical protein